MDKIRRMFLSLITNQLTFYTTNIKHTIDKIKETNQSILKIIHIDQKGEINKVFCRVETSAKCNFCPKVSYYQDDDNKYYCWFHRSNYE